MADLLRLVAPAWVDDPNLVTLTELSSEFFNAGHRRRVGDMIWRVRSRDGRLADGRRPCVLIRAPPGGAGQRGNGATAA